MFSILFLFLLFYLCLPFVDSIYYYHFGIVANSDALYPIMIAKDLLNGYSFAKGWYLPPSNYLFPDVSFFLVTSSIEDFRFLFIAWVSFLIWILFWILKKSRIGFLPALLLPFLFLRWGGKNPEFLGQAFLPGFHGGMLFGLSLLYLSRPFGKEKYFNHSILCFKNVLLCILLSLSLFSDLWFLPSIVLPFLVTYFIYFPKSFKRDWIILFTISLLTYLCFAFAKREGWHLFQYSGVPVKFHFPFLLSSWINHSYSYTKTFTSPDSTWFVWFFLSLLTIRLVFLSIKQFKSENPSKRDNAWEFFWILTILFQFCFLLFYGIPPKIRYLIPSIICFFSLIFFWLKQYPWRGNLLPSFVILFLIFDTYSNQFFEMKNQITKGKNQMSERVACLNSIQLKHKNVHLVSDYWATKYAQFFSQGTIRPIPFDENFTFYKWIHNEQWNLKQKTNENQHWANAVILRENEAMPEPLKELTQKEQIQCGDWKWIVFAENFVF